MPKQVEITPEVRAILERGHWPEPAVFALPPGQLDRKLYEAVNKVLAALGGKWDRKAQGHRFAAAARADLEAALADGVAVDQKRTLEQFFTPPGVADLVVALARIERENTVLEPSAGDGALIEAIAKEHPSAIITAVEIDPALVGRLQAKWGLRAQIIAANFLALPRNAQAFDRVVMNPPFGRTADIEHVTRAFSLLRPGGVLASIMSPHWTFAGDRESMAFRDLLRGHRHDWTPLPEGSFRGSGTGVNTGILTIEKGAI